MRIPTNDVPIFPLSTVLFPEGVLSLRIFEARYLDMVSSCLKQDTPFGVCLIVDGHEVGLGARCYQVGTLAKIIDWHQPKDGVLEIEALGCQRFKMLDSQIAGNELTTATIQLLEEIPAVAVPNEMSRLTTMLKNVVKKSQPNVSLDEESLNDADWVGFRLTEVLPMENVIRQRLLEMDDPIERLQSILGLFSSH
ncbi:MAG: LON peptidase substrate-binding domain-containing protein [Cycloclasticus sp.]|nr:LON peptidase substrate-binding domain-containing protein [Cycloclasticus sp.]